MPRDLSVFVADNERWRSEKQHRVPWKERLELIKQEFPSAFDPDWNAILRDDEIFARILKDIFKVDEMEPGRAGPRPNLDPEKGRQRWQEVTRPEFSELPFAQAFQVLARHHGHSLTTIARRTSLSRSVVHRLMTGKEEPTIEEMRCIAASYKKKPAYFMEYRIEYILAAFAARLEQSEEMTIAIYTKLVRA